MSSMLQDLRFALRSLRRRPVFATFAIVALALGVGGTTSMFSVVDGVLLKKLPYRDPSTVVSIWKAWPSWRGEPGLDYVWDHIHFPWGDYLQVRDHATSLETVAAHAQEVAVMTGDGNAEELSIGEASANLFEMLGVRMPLGRGFASNEVAPAGEPARLMVLSHELWQRRFGGDPSVLGQTTTLGAEAFEIIGVLPPRFRLPSDLIATHDNGGDVDPGLRDAWLPLGYHGADRGNSFELIARLAPGASAEQAQAEVQSLMTDGPDDQIARVVPRKDVLTRGYGTPLVVLLAAAGLLMLIACTNVMGLLLGEAPGRQREISVRAALGAPPRRILRQLLTENVLLGLAGAGLGFWVARIGTSALLAVAPPLPRLEAVTIDGRVMLFAAVAGVATGLVFGMLPALHLVRGAGAKLRVRASSKRARPLQSLGVAAQVGLTVVLLVSAGLFGRSLLQLFAVEPGFRTAQLAALELRMPPEEPTTPDDRTRFLDAVYRASTGTPGVVAASAARRLPFASGNGTQSFSFLRDGEEVGSTQLPMFVHPSYFEMLGIPLLQGRSLQVSDNRDTEPVIVISRALAEQNWPDRSPIGERVRYRGRDWTIVGVVGDVLHQALGDDTIATFYASAYQVAQHTMQLIVRTTGEPSTVLPTLRERLVAIHPNIAIREAGTMTNLMKESASDAHFRAVLLGTFATLATLLAVIGIFGVTARSIAARSRELGIRSALGAPLRALELLVLRDGLASALLGVVGGLLGAIVAARWIGHLLFEVPPLDPLTYAGATVLATTVCLIAAYLPARKIARIQPREVMTDDQS